MTVLYSVEVSSTEYLLVTERFLRGGRMQSLELERWDICVRISIQNMTNILFFQLVLKKKVTALLREYTSSSKKVFLRHLWKNNISRSQLISTSRRMHLIALARFDWANICPFYLKKKFFHKRARDASLFFFVFDHHVSLFAAHVHWWLSGAIRKKTRAKQIKKADQKRETIFETRYSTKKKTKKIYIREKILASHHTVHIVSTEFDLLTFPVIRFIVLFIRKK